MFSVQTNEQELCVSLCYTSDQFKIELFPEDERSVPIEIGDSGEIDGRPSNGDFYLGWTPERIEFIVARSGDGRGGSLHVTVPNNVQTNESLKMALNKWKDDVAKWSS